MERKRPFDYEKYPGIDHSIVFISAKKYKLIIEIFRNPLSLKYQAKTNVWRPSNLLQNLTVYPCNAINNVWIDFFRLISLIGILSESIGMVLGIFFYKIPMEIYFR